MCAVSFWTDLYGKPQDFETSSLNVAADIICNFCRKMECDQIFSEPLQQHHSDQWVCVQRLNNEWPMYVHTRACIKPPHNHANFLTEASVFLSAAPATGLGVGVGGCECGREGGCSKVKHTNAPVSSKCCPSFCRSAVFPASTVNVWVSERFICHSLQCFLFLRH